MPDNTIIALTGETLSFGGYADAKKQKAEGFDWNGDIYNLKTYNQVTRLEKNGSLLYESVPGTLVKDFTVTESQVSFLASGKESTQITMELYPEAEYDIFVAGQNAGTATANKSGKVNFSAELHEKAKAIKLVKL